MSSFLCFICHSTVNAEISEETREKYREVVGMNLCLDSQLCHICCHVLNKLALFRSVCLKRSLEYPVLFSEKGTLNLQKSNTEILEIVCPDSSCDDRHDSGKSFQFTHDSHDNCDPNIDYAQERSQYVGLEDTTAYQISNDDYQIKTEDTHQELNQTDKNESLIINKYDDTFYHSDDSVSNNNQPDIDDGIKVDNDIEYRDDETRLQDDCDDNIYVNNTKNQEGFNDELKTDIGKSKVSKEKGSRKKKTSKVKPSIEEQKALLEARRKEKKYLDAEFKCYNCAIPFLFKDTYQAHMMRHEESNGEYQCAVCTLRFASPGGLRSHALNHAPRCVCGATRRRCVCGPGARPPQRVACHLCGNLLKDASGLQQHLRRIHTKESTGRLHPCAVCGDSLPTQRQLRTHMMKHIKRKFRCDECPSTYSSPYTLGRHRARAHRPAPATAPAAPRTCGTCGKQCSSERGLAEHARRHRRTFLECPVCARACPDRRSLALHVQAVHSGTKDHACPHCDARYSTRRSLLRHVAGHTQKKEPKIAICHLCGASFKGQNKLNRHLKNVCEKAKLEEQLAELYEQDLT